MKINVTEKGSLKIYNGLVSGFSSSNYLEVTPSFDVSSAQNWEIVYKIITGTSLSAQSMCGHTGSSNYDPFTIDINSSKFQLNLCKSSSSNLLKDQKGTYTVLTNTTYWLKLTFDGSKYVLSYSLDGVDFIEDVVFENTTKIWTSNLVLGRQQGDGSEYPFLGTIDLKDCYIKIDGEIWWTGTVEGTQFVRAYGLDVKKYKYYKEVVTEGESYACFYHSSWGYIYFKKPYNIGDICYYNVAENMGLVNSVSELTTGFFKISAINSDGSISCPFDVLGGSSILKFSPYPSGDLTSTTGDLEPSTPDDYDVIKIEDSFHGLRIKGEIKYYKEVEVEGDVYECFGIESLAYYAKKPYAVGDFVYCKNGVAGNGAANSVSELGKCNVAILEIGNDSITINASGYSLPMEHYPSGDLTSTTTTLIPSTKDDYDIIKEVNGKTYSLMRRKK